MPISGLTLALVDDDDDARAALAVLRRDPHVELGVQNGRRLAAVLDTPDEATNKRAWRTLGDLPGIAHVDVVFVAFDEDVPVTGTIAAPIDSSTPLEPKGSVR